MTDRWGRLSTGALAVAVGIAVWAQPGRAQDPLERTPDLSGGWVSRPGMVHFNFLHRFSSTSAPERKVTSAPTFLLAAGRAGTLCVFSSVAGDRGRSPVVLYGAAKAGLSRYLEGLDHRFHRAGLRVVCVKPGFVRTGMTEGQPAPPFAGEPEGVARDVLRAIDRGAPVVYTPPIWRLVMLAVRCLPRAVMRRVGF